MNQEVNYGRKWLVLASVSLGVFMATLDGSIVNVALPTLERELNTSFALVQWVVLAYLLTLVTLTLVVGRLGDMFGKKPLYIAGFFLFILGSGLCGLSQNIYALIGFRVLQALGAVMTMSLGAAITTEAFPPSERGKALGITGLMVSLGAISGPTIGGLLLGSLSWHWIFWVNLPIGLLAVLVGLRVLPNYKPVGRQRFDFAGAAVLCIGLLSLLMAITLGQERGFDHPLTLSLLGLFLLFVFLFIRIETRQEQPMVDLRLFSNRLFTVNLVTGFLTFVCSAGMVILLPFYLQIVLRLDPRTAGILLAVVPLSMGITAPIAGSLSDRFGTRPLTVIGLLILLAGYLSAQSLGTDTSPLRYALTLLPVGVGMGAFQSPNNSTIMGSVPRQRLGVASGLLSITRTMGQTLGISIMGGVWATIVTALFDGPLPGGATEAPAAVQVQALHITLWIIIALIAVAFFLSLEAFLTERRQRREQAVAAD